MEAIVFIDSIAGRLGGQDAGRPFLMTAFGFLASRPPSLPALNPILKTLTGRMYNFPLQFLILHK
jgi:hypothetical protein